MISLPRLSESFGLHRNQISSFTIAVRMIWRALVLLLVVSSPLCALAATPQAVVIAIQPLGSVKQERIAAMKKGLEDAFGITVGVLEEKPLPQEAWHAPRKRYRAEKLLTFLSEKTPRNHQIVVGITAKDVSTTKDEHVDWGIFGLGELDGRVCVVSTFRLGARGADETKLRDRLRKIAVHEAGHVMSLDHCLKKGCVMQDAESSIVTVDDETGKFCDECKAACLKWLAGKAE